MLEMLSEKIRAIVTPTLKVLSLELIELSVQRRTKKIAIEIIADRIGGGITIEECGQINRQLNNIIEQQQLLAADQDYVIEVCSPGLDRPLKTAVDFARMIGRQVRFCLLQAVEQKYEYVGEVKSIREQEVVISSSEEKIKSQRVFSLDYTEIVIPLTKIGKAVQVI